VIWLFLVTASSQGILFIRDVVEASFLALSQKTAFGEVFTIETGVTTSINELAKVRLEATNKTCKNYAFLS